MRLRTFIFAAFLIGYFSPSAQAASPCILHSFVSAEADSGDTKVSSDEWNACHDDYTVKIVEIVVIDFTTAVTTGDGKYYFPIPSTLNGHNLVSVSGHVITVSSSGAVNVDLARCAVVATGNTCSGTVVDMLPVNLTIDANESKSSSAATAVDIDETNDDVATDQVVRVDVDGAGTGTQGLILLLGFQLP